MFCSKELRNKNGLHLDIETFVYIWSTFMWCICVLFTYKLYFMVNSMHIVQTILVTYIQQLGVCFLGSIEA